MKNLQALQEQLSLLGKFDSLKEHDKTSVLEAIASNPNADLALLQNVAKIANSFEEEQYKAAVLKEVRARKESKVTWVEKVSSASSQAERGL